MSYEISVHHDDISVLLAELSHLVHYLRARGHEQCEVLFGWHWGMDYYPTSRWFAEVFTLAELESKVREVERAGLGRFGGDDLRLKVPGAVWEFCFCHHSGVHLKFTRPCKIAEDFLARWHAGGLSPIEREVRAEPDDGVLPPSGEA